MYVINQPWDGRGEQMGNHLVRLLSAEAPRFQVFRACVAFAKASGVLRLAPALQKFMDRGGRVEIVVGIDEDITTRQALEMIMKFSTVAYVFSNPTATFHPKVYLFETPERWAAAFVGSSNLTVGGLYTNYEANLGLEFDLTVAADREAYHRILAIFSSASDVSSGNALQLDAAVLDQLTRAGAVGDESRTRARRASVRRRRSAEPALFPRKPVPPAPPIDPGLIELAPRVAPTGDIESDEEAASELQPWKLFVMLLGSRDTRQKPGFSRDVFIPLAARHAAPDFWGWPAQFRLGSDATVGQYMERRIDILVRPAHGKAQVVEDTRLYYYSIKHEFRLNCSRLVEGAQAGDLLAVQKSPAGAYFDGHTYEFEATVLPMSDPAYAALIQECRNQVSGSPKRWGYV